MTNAAPQARTPRETPKFTGIIIHRDPRGRFTLRYPSDWHVFEINSDVPPTEVAAAPDTTAGAGGGSQEKRKGTRGKARRQERVASPVAAREGIGFAPNAQDPATVCTAWVSPLEEGVVAEDLGDLRAGVEDALDSLEDCHVEATSEVMLGNLIRFERVYTFRERHAADDPGTIRKRKQWLLYVDRWLMCLTWQGSSEEEFDYWFAMANQTFLTFEVPEALWFSTDRELLAQLSHKQTGKEAV